MVIFKATVYRIRNMLVHLLIVLVAPAVSSFHFVDNPSCMKDCSWTFQAEDGSSVLNRCVLEISPDNIGEFPYCPNPVPHVEGFLNVAENINAEFFQVRAPVVPSKDGTDVEKTALCVNITFQAQRGSEADLKGFRITAEPTSYGDVGSTLCQRWSFPVPLDDCALTTGICSFDTGRERLFHYDCFCGFQPGPGLLNVSVDTLPKSRRQHQSFIEFPIPECEDPVMKNNGHCTVGIKERWRPLHSSTLQLCDYDSLNVTFDLLDSKHGVKEYYVFLYKVDFLNNCSVTSSPVLEESVSVTTADIAERTIANRTVNFTTVTFTGLRRHGLPESYILGYRIAELGCTTKRVCEPLRVEEDPCFVNPCPMNSVCTPDCFQHICSCLEGFLSITHECRGPWHPGGYSHHSLHNNSVVITFNETAPRGYNVTSYDIVLLNGTTIGPVDPKSVVVDPNGRIDATFDDLTPYQYYKPAIKIAEGECPDCQYQYYEAFQYSPESASFPLGPLYTAVGAGAPVLIVLVMFGAVCWRLRSQSSRRNGDDGLLVHADGPSEGPSISDAALSGVRLVCNPNPLLQDFADRLRQLLQCQLGCPVALHTVRNVGRAMDSSWLSEARAHGEKLCFIWDENLAILEYKSHDDLLFNQGLGQRSCDWSPDHPANCSICKVVRYLTENDLNQSVLLMFDFAASTTTLLPECPRFSLPSDLSKFVRRLNPEVEEQDIEDAGVQLAYANIETVARTNIYDRSVVEWKTVPCEAMDESGIEEDLSDSMVSLDEEDIDERIIGNMALLGERGMA